MVNVLLFLGGLAILLVSSRQVFLMFRDGSFRARGNRLIVRNAHPIIFWMNFRWARAFRHCRCRVDVLAIAYLSARGGLPSFKGIAALSDIFAETFGRRAEFGREVHLSPFACFARVQTHNQ
jgi:hypothetical protein